MVRAGVKIASLLMVLSCSETDFDAMVAEQQPTTGTGDVVADGELSAEGLPPTALTTQLFTLNPAASERAVVQFNLAQDDTEAQIVVMESRQDSKAQTVVTEVRSEHSKQVRQTGSEGRLRTDTFTRSRDKGLLDLLLVIDDSRSMIRVHESLATKLNSLLRHIDNSNWQIKIIDVDGSNMCRDYGIITKNNEHSYGTALTALKTKANNNPNTNERTLQKARYALGLTVNCRATWLRPESTLAAVIISNEDYQCTNRAAPDASSGGNSFRCGNQVVDFIADFRGLRTHTRLFGIFDTEMTCGVVRDHSNAFGREYTSSHYANPCYQRNDNYKPFSNNYQRGNFDRILSILDQNYDSTLTGISSGIRDKLQDQFTLTEVPDLSTLSVTVGGKPMTSGFTVNNKILIFSNLSGDGIRVSYVPRGKRKAYIADIAIDTQADLSTLQVRVRGKNLVKGTHYTVSGSTVTIQNVKTNFPAGATAHLRWQKKQQHDPKQREFPFATDREVVAGSVSIARYDKSSYRVQKNPNRIVFNSGEEPDYDTRFTVSYRYYGHDILRYPLRYAGNYPITSVSCSPVSCTHNNGDVVFNSRDFQRGRPITATLTVRGLRSDRRPLPEHYVPDSLQLTGDSDTCTAAQLVIEQGEVLLTHDDATANGCAMLNGLRQNHDQDMELSYLSFTAQKEIEVSIEELLEYVGYRKEIWEVYVAGEKKEKGKDYTVSARKITFQGDYPPNTSGEIKIYVSY